MFTGLLYGNKAGEMVTRWHKYACDEILYYYTYNTCISLFAFNLIDCVKKWIKVRLFCLKLVSVLHIQEIHCNIDPPDNYSKSMQHKILLCCENL